MSQFSHPKQTTFFCLQTKSLSYHKIITPGEPFNY